MIFVIRTHHGDYLHEATVNVPDEAGDIEAWELIQRQSPYTPNVEFDAGNSNHVKCVQNVAYLRGDAHEPDYSPRPGWVAGHSWTWIIDPVKEPVD